jgi:hypothetical protein
LLLTGLAELMQRKDKKKRIIDAGSLARLVDELEPKIVLVDGKQDSVRGSYKP